MHSLFRVLILLVVAWGVMLCLPPPSEGAIYHPTVEAGDTLVAANEDTTNSILLYESTSTSRCNNGAIWITQTEIGANITQHQLQVITEVAASNLAKASTGWFKVNVQSFYVSDNDNPVCVPLPFLDGLTALYGRWRLAYVDGRTADATAYSAIYTADPGPSLARPTTRAKTIGHTELKGAVTSFACNGTGIDSTVIVDLRIETVPGWFQVPDRGWVSAKAGSKADDDTITVYMYSAWGSKCTATCDTLTINIANGGGSTALMSPYINGTSSLPQYTYYKMINESADAADTTNFFLEVTVEKNP